MTEVKTQFSTEIDFLAAAILLLIDKIIITW